MAIGDSLTKREQTFIGVGVISVLLALSLIHI